MQVNKEVKIRGFKLYDEMYEIIKTLSDEDAGIIFKSIMNFIIKDIEPEFTDEIIIKSWNDMFKYIDKSKKEAIKYWSKRDE